MESVPVSRRTRRRLIALAVAGLLVVAGALMLNGRLEALVLHIARARLHRDIRVAGDFEARIFTREPSVTASQVYVGNPSFMAAGELAQIEGVTLLLRWQWTRPFLAIHRLELRGASLHLVREADGRANWHQQPGGPGAGPPLMDSLFVPQAHIELADERRHLRFSGVVSATDVAQVSGPPALRIEGSGQLNGRAARFEIAGAPLSTARRTDPYSFTLEEHSGDARLSGHGALDHAFDFRALHGSFAAEGPNLADLYYLVGLHFPHSGPFKLSGELARSGMRFEYRDLAATTGDSDMAGSVSVDSSSGRAQVEARLESQRLRLADLSSHETAAHEPQELSDTPLRINGLRRADSQIHYRAHTLQLAKEELGEVAALISIERGILAVRKFSASAAGGRLEGHAQLDASHEVPQAALDMSAADIHLEDLPHTRADRAALSGLLNARLEVTSRGTSVHEMATAATGHVVAAIPQGTMRASFAELAGLEVGGALGLLAHSQKQTEIRCAVASFEARDGVLTSRTIVIDTDKTLITGHGAINLDTQALDLSFHGRPKHPSLALHSDLAVGGTLSKPTARLAGHGAAVQSGAAVALGVLLTPVAAALAFINPGVAHDADCATLLAEEKATPPTG
jgi:AsmA family protein